MHNFFPLRFSPPMTISAGERRAMIETAAYLRAERRNFEPGHEVEDWLAAEAEVDDRMLMCVSWSVVRIATDAAPLHVF
jgi:hypothetical protein